MKFQLVRNLKGEEVLGKTIYNSEGKILLIEGIKLERVYVNQLKQNGIYYIYVQDESLDDVIPTDAVTGMKQSALKDMPSIFNSLIYNEKEKVEESMKSVENLVNSIIEQNSINTNLYEINQDDNYTYIHCIDTGIMSIILGRALGMTPDELKKLGVGAMLHDIGKVKISQQIINKKGSLTKEEFEEVKKHPMYGYRTLREAGVTNKDILAMVFSHHERVDGTGYPLKIKGNRISQSAKIVGLCDVFTALSANRSYRERFSPSEAYEYIISKMNTSFDEDIVKKFKETFSIYPIGCCVVLSDGVEGYVIRQNKYSPDRPVIRVNYNLNFFNLKSQKSNFEFIFPKWNTITLRMDILLL